MEYTVNINGALVDEGQARVSVLDHGYLYGDGVFEGMRIYAGKIFKLEEHLQRLHESAKVLMLGIPWSREQMVQELLKTREASGLTEGLRAFGGQSGVGTLGIDPGRCPKPQIVIIMGAIQLYPEEFYQKGIPIITAATRRPSPDVLETRVKSLNYLNNILGKIEAKNAGVLEAIMLNKEGYVVECTADNIFFVKNGVLKTPDPVHGALDGITRKTILELAQELNLPSETGLYTRFDLYTADECFLTGSGAEIVPVVAIDGRAIGEGEPGAMTQKLRGQFQDFVRHQV
jgi:branched-chain amino acid aminotransferase